MKLDMAIRELHRSERRLATSLSSIRGRHRAEHEIYFVSGDLARWSVHHITELARAGRGYGLNLAEYPRTTSLTLPIQEKLNAALRRRATPALLLLADLRHLHRIAAGVSLDWELLAQGAQGAKDTELIALAQQCHPQTLRQMRWANAMLKPSHHRFWQAECEAGSRHEIL